MNELREAIERIDSSIADPKFGLPQPIFDFISRIIPLVNVDLLIQDELGRTLLAWRNDQYSKGWHVPGRIMRYQETLHDAVRKTAEQEIGTQIDFDAIPIDVNEHIHPEYETRGHLISILYRCRLPKSFVPDNKGRSSDTPGYLSWHNGCPDDMIKCQKTHYRDYMTVRIEREGGFIYEKL